MNGFLNLAKPAGMTSHTAVARVRRLVGRNVKVGHAGTLDPAATGVLPLALGYATRLIEYFVDAPKGYRALVRLGITTTTDDAEGAVLIQTPLPPLEGTTIEAALVPFRGAIMQVPPQFSAIHHQGRRLYELARAGEVVELAPRPVTITQLELVTFDLPDLVLNVACSKGTYIRSLARDFGRVLGCGAHLAALERTFVGQFTLANAIPLAAIENDPSLLIAHLLPPETAVADWPLVPLDESALERVYHGLPLPSETAPPSEMARAHNTAGRLVALLQYADGLWKPIKVFKGE